MIHACQIAADISVSSSHWAHREASLWRGGERKGKEKKKERKKKKEKKKKEVLNYGIIVSDASYRDQT